MANVDNPRILMIAPRCYPPVEPEGMVNAKLALAIKSAGLHIDIITAGGSDNFGRYPNAE